jgi:3D (Asp-Asp-Asp) domain-containing protein
MFGSTKGDAMLRLVSCAASIAVLAACASNPSGSQSGDAAPPPSEAAGSESVEAFTLAAPDAPGASLTLWSTNYYTPVYAPSTAADALPLIEVGNAAISPRLARRDWCNISLQGTAMIRDANGKATAYVIADSKGAEQINCDDRLGNLSQAIKIASRKARYKIVSHPYGCGVRNMPLIPFRTIAVDPAIIPFTTVLYIPGLRGLSFQLEGRTYAHDGYVFAGDRGGAIKGVHIDFFSGNQSASPFPTVIASHESKTFQAFVVPADHAVALQLVEQHRPPC